MAFISFSGPVCGVIVGGIITTAMGGYQTKRCLRCIVIMTWVGVCATLPMPFLDSFFWFFALLWFVLFVGGFILPAITGTMLTTVEDKLRGSANSIS